MFLLWFLHHTIRNRPFRAVIVALLVSSVIAGVA